MKYLSITAAVLKSAAIIALMAGSLSAQPDSYEPIFQITGENPTSYIGMYIANCGDQDGDGSDELLISSMDPDEVWMFYGGEQLDTIPDLIFYQPGTINLVSITYGENLRSSDYGSILIGRVFGNYMRLFLYDSGTELNTVYDLSFIGEQANDGFGAEVGIGDVNGDGWNDLVTSEENYELPGFNNRGKLLVYYGGPDMDNIADFTITADYNNFGSGLGSGLACGDANGDGFDDILAMTSSPRKAWLFYGGAELDSIPDWSYQDYLTGHCTIVPDLTGDIYADIILAPTLSPSAYVFFGGISLNSTPDQNINISSGDLHYVGSLDGDAYGDLIGRSQPSTLVRPLFGSSSGIVPGTIIDTQGTPISTGNCGDINGDGFNDLAFALREPLYYGQFFIYADTTLSSIIREPGTENRTFTLLPAYPNPFNAQTVIPFTLDRSGKVTLTVYDVLGRSVGVQYIEPLQGGMHEVVWNAEGMASGTYLVRLDLLQRAGTLLHSETRKVVLVK